MEFKEKLGKYDQDDPPKAETKAKVSPTLLTNLKQIARVLDKVLLKQCVLEDEISSQLDRHQENDTTVILDSEQISGFNRIVSAPYFKTDCSKERLVAPAFSQNFNRSCLPLREWKPIELSRLQLCVHRVNFHRQLFFCTGRFHQMFLDVGFHMEDLTSLQLLQNKFDTDLWKLMCSNDKVPVLLFSYESKKMLTKFLEVERNLFQELILKYQKQGILLKPWILKAEISAHINLVDLITWKQQEIKALYENQLKLGNPKILCEEIDWEMVSKEMMDFSTLRFTADECKRTFIHCISNSFNHGPMTITELERLKLFTQRKKNIDWSEVTADLGTNRTKIQVFHAYKTHILKNKGRGNIKLSERDKTAVNLVKECKGNLVKVVSKLSNKFGPVSLKTFRSTWKSINPSFVRGHFYPEEDALLLVAMEIYQNQLIHKDFSGVQKLLPWRYCSVWRLRAESLFQESNTIWTIQEDYMLLELVAKYGLQWSGLQNMFAFKTSKACSQRYRLLERKLEIMTLEQYHVIYSRRQEMEIRKCKQLHAVGELLKTVIQEKIHHKLRLVNSNLLASSGVADTDEVVTPEYIYNPRTFIFNPPRPGARTTQILKSFKLETLLATFSRLVIHLNRIDAFRKDTKTNEKRFNYNRRKFDRSDPISVASALHIRGISLVPKDEAFWNSLSNFEKCIYSMYNIFSCSWSSKQRSPRNSIPSRLELALLPELHRIIVPPKEAISATAISPMSPVSVYDEMPVFTYQSDLTKYELPVTSQLLQAQKKLQQRLKDKSDTRRGPMKKTIIREQRKAAANLYWNSKPKSEKIKPNKTVRSNLPREIPWEDRVGKLGGPPLLTVLHDHSYTKNFKTWKNDVEEDIKKVTQHRPLAIYGVNVNN